MPKFRNSADLEAILKEAFSIYEDFKAELIKQETSSWRAFVTHAVVEKLKIMRSLVKQCA